MMCYHLPFFKKKKNDFPVIFAPKDGTYWVHHTSPATVELCCDGRLRCQWWIYPQSLFQGENIMPHMPNPGILECSVFRPTQFVIYSSAKINDFYW